MKHIDTQRTTMFRNSIKEVRDRLATLIRSVEESMLNRADEVFVAMSRDYRSVLGGSNIPKGEVMPRWQRSMQKDVMKVIESAEAIFKKAAGIYDRDEENKSTDEWNRPEKSDVTSDNASASIRSAEPRSAAELMKAALTLDDDEEDHGTAHADSDGMESSAVPEDYLSANDLTPQIEDEIPDTPSSSEDSY